MIKRIFFNFLVSLNICRLNKSCSSRRIILLFDVTFTYLVCCYLPHAVFYTCHFVEKFNRFWEVATLVIGKTELIVFVAREAQIDVLRVEVFVPTAFYGQIRVGSKADVKPESKASLDQIGELLKQRPDLKLHVVGHTDNVGAVDGNMALSKRRAEAVVAALAGSYGVNRARLTGNGVASLAPVKSNTTEEGRAKNRRVELVLQ